MQAIFAVFVLLGAGDRLRQAPGAISLRKAEHHAMQYYVSLPNGWKAGKAWPVVVAIEDAERDFKRHADIFAKARRNKPFILVIPEVVTNGGPHYREASGYTYKQADWDRISKDGDWRFDDEGLAAVVADVHRLYGGESRYFLTGWEAGAHTVFALAFNHPERLAAVAPVCPNYAGRNVVFSSSPARLTLPIRVFAGSQDPAWSTGKPLYDQTKRAEAEAVAHGFKFTYQVVASKGHEPLAGSVLDWFAGLARS
jgi:dienelactone hydrolase